MITIGSGNTGCKFATMYDRNPYLISTAEQDSANYSDYNILTISKEGAGKRFRTGEKIWKDNIETLSNFIEPIKNENVVVFSSFGGGSGSSSLQFLSKLLLKQNNKILIVGVVPYKKEINPPLANAVQTVNSLIPLIHKTSVMLFDNQTLIKRFDNNWNSINKFIISRTNYITKIYDKLSVDGYSPTTIDQSEIDSVVFGGGFIDVSDNFLEEETPKFTYGKLSKETKNVLLAMFVDIEVSDEDVNKYHSTLTEVQNKIAGRAKNARFIPGIIRGRVISEDEEGNKRDRAYILIASGLNIESYMKKIEKIRDQAIEKAIAYNEQVESDNIVSSQDRKILDI